MKISLLKKRKERLVQAQAKGDLKPNGSLESESTVEEVKNAEDSEASRESADIKKDFLLDVAGGTDTDVEAGSDQVFKSPHAAEVHFKKTHKKPAVRPPTDCEECGKKFASAFQLREHISIQHLKERNFVCEECGQKFGRRGGLRRHVQMVHQNHLHMCPYEGCDHPGYKCSK
ncbi:zinc finger, C2H2 type, partial [Oesophagostomum dentatum]